MNKVETIKAIAEAFRANLRGALSVNQLIEIDAKNKTPEYLDCCASHDYCDANVYTDEAFTSVMGREICLQDHSDCYLWNKAWEAVKTWGFRWKLVEQYCERGHTINEFEQALSRCRGDAQVRSDSLTVLKENFGVSDPRYCLDLKALVQEMQEKEQEQS